MLCFREMRLLALLSIILLAGVLARWWFWLGPGKAEITWASPITSSEVPGEEGTSTAGSANSIGVPSDSNTPQATSGENTSTLSANAPALPYENAISTVESSISPDDNQAPGVVAQASDTAAQAPVTSGPTSAPCTAAPGAKARIELNTATIEQLLTLPGIGPVLAQAILDERVRRGRFTAIADLLNVKGIGQVRLEKITPFVCVLNS